MLHVIQWRHISPQLWRHTMTSFRPFFNGLIWPCYTSHSDVVFAEITASFTELPQPVCWRQFLFLSLLLCTRCWRPLSVMQEGERNAWTLKAASSAIVPDSIFYCELCNYYYSLLCHADVQHHTRPINLLKSCFPSRNLNIYNSPMLQIKIEWLNLPEVSRPCIQQFITSLRYFEDFFFYTLTSCGAFDRIASCLFIACPLILILPWFLSWMNFGDFP